ncbi:hypothetical protein SRABI106_04347 [Rahnella aquatilis]|nr:hypothetical protein SRABI106_04347 [Rahnella aquatilis]
MPDDVGWDTFAEVGFEAIDAHIHQTFQMARVPFSGLRMSEIHDAHTSLPFIPLPDTAVRAFEQITFFFTFTEKR